MKIEYNKEEKFITINDEIKNVKLLMNFMLWGNVISTSLFSYKYYDKGNYLEFLIFFTLLILLLISSLYVYFKIDYRKNTLVKDIKNLHVKKVFNVKRYSLQLKNGKYRRLPFLKDKKEIEKLEIFIQENQ